MLKNLNLKIPIVLILLSVTDASYKSPNLGPSTWLSCAPYYSLFLPQTPFCRLHLLFSPFPAIMHTKYEKAKQLTGKQHFIYSLLRHTTRQKFNTVFSSCPEVVFSRNLHVSGAGDQVSSPERSGSNLDIFFERCVVYASCIEKFCNSPELSHL